MSAHINDRLYRFLAGVSPVQVFKDGVLLTGKSVIDVEGSYYHTIQMSLRDGSDIIQVRGSIDGVTWVTLTTPLDALNANGIYQFSGVWKFLEITKASGTGVTTNIFYMGQR